MRQYYWALCVLKALAARKRLAFRGAIGVAIGLVPDYLQVTRFYGLAFV